MKPDGFYLSYSRMNLYLTDPSQYYMQYVLGVKPEPTRNMVFGSIGHKAMADPAFDWRAELRRLKFMAAEEAAMARALSALPAPGQPEVEFTVESPVCTLYGFIDNEDVVHFREYKFACGGAWNKPKVDEAMQLTFYAYAQYLRYGRLPDQIWLDHANKVTGLVKSYQRREVTQADIDNLLEKISFTCEGIKNERWTK